LNLFLTALDNVVFHEKSQSIVTLTALNLFLSALNLSSKYVQEEQE